MQKSFYDDETIAPENVVGSYGWHEKFPYESQLLFKRGDIRLPLFESTKDRVALDFGCGPGRMVSRMSGLFKRVDGVDISQRLLNKAKEMCPDSDFYLSSGTNLGSVPKNEYDFIFSTIAMQHIAVRSFRINLLKEMREALRVGGKINIQMAFNIDSPFTINKGSLKIGKYKVRLLKEDVQNAHWEDDKINAEGTNGSCDATIGYEDIPKVVEDFEMFFDEVSFWFYDVRLLYHDLEGEKHGTGYNYWPTHWIFISGVKKSKRDPKKSSPSLRSVWNKKNAEYQVFDKNSLGFRSYQAFKDFARGSSFYEPVKKYIKQKFPNRF